MPINPGEITWDDEPPVEHPQQPMGTAGPQESDIQWDDAPQGAPPIQGQVRHGTVTVLDDEIKPQEINPTYTVAGFSDEVAPDKEYHTGLTKEDKQEYASFFADPKKPPSASELQLWYHLKTGAQLANAQQIVDIFKKTGKFSTAEKITVPARKQSAGAAFVNHTANAVALDYGPEIGAALDTIGLGGSDRPNIFTGDGSLSDIWANNADLERAQLEQDAAGHPIASMGGEMAGVALTAPLLGRVGNAAGLQRVAQAQGELPRALIQGTAEGAAYGSGAAGPGDRLQGAVIGAATVPVVAGVAKLPFTAVEAGKTVLQGSPGLARRIVAKAIKADENAPASAGAEMMSAQANDVPMMLADTGENARGLLAAASRSSGPARTITRDALEMRQSGLAERVTNAIERDLGPVSNPHQVADDLMTSARDNAAPLYDAAYSKPGADVFAQKVAPLLDRPSMQKALGKAYRIAAEEGRNPEELGLIRDANGNVKLSDTITLGSDESGALTMGRDPVTAPAPTWQTLDYVKRGMDDVVESYRDPVTGKLRLDTEGRAINNTLRTYMRAFDAANPEYAAARKAYSDPVSGINAMNAGRKALNMTADDLEARMRDMTPFEKEMFALGARRAMAEAIASKGDSANIINTIAGTGKKRAMLARLFGDRTAFKRFVQTLGQEKEGFRTFARAMTGSPTALNLEDDATLKFAATAADMAANGGLPIATAVREAVKFGIGKIGDKTKQQVAALLSETDPAVFREMADRLREEAVRRGIFKRKINTVTNAIGKGAVVSQPQ